MKKLLIVYHSMTGGSRQMALAAAQAAQPEAQTMLQPAAETHAGDLLAADGVIIVTPENLASMAGMMKDLFDRVYYDLEGQTSGKPYAIMVCAGSDGSGAIRQIERIATGLRWKAVAPALIVHTHAQTREAILASKTIAAEDLQRCAELGAAFAAGLSAGIF